MPEMTIIVEFEAHEGREPQLTALLRDHALLTREEEPGCLRFEVLKPVDPDGAPIPNRLLVSELYTDAAAVAAHERNPRLPVLRATMAPLLKSRRLILATALDGRPQQDLTPDQLNASNDE